MSGHAHAETDVGTAAFLASIRDMGRGALQAAAKEYGSTFSLFLEDALDIFDRQLDHLTGFLSSRAAGVSGGTPPAQTTEPDSGGHGSAVPVTEEGHMSDRGAESLDCIQARARAIGGEIHKVGCIPAWCWRQAIAEAFLGERIRDPEWAERVTKR
jgi:hypothetical protein